MSSLDYFIEAKKSVLVIGASGMDIIANMVGSPTNGTSIPASIRSSFGGVARNIAENLARLGLDVFLMTIVGDDFYGKELLERIEEVGVDTRACFILEKQRTGIYIAALDHERNVKLAMGDMQILNYLSSKKIQQFADLFSHVGLVYLDANIPPKTIQTIFHLACREKVPVCVDPTSTLLAPRFLPYLDQVMMVNPNIYEAAILCNQEMYTQEPDSGLQAARCLVNRGVQIAIVSLAESGVCYATEKTSGYIPAIRTKIIDPIGVGDALSAASIFGLLNQMPLDESIRLGVSAATLTLRNIGTVYPGLTLDRLYNELVI